MKIQKKYVIAGSLVVVSFTLAAIYLQYKKIMDYSLGFSKIKVKTLGLKLVNFDLFLTFTNKSNLSFDLVEQDYSVYFNGKFVSKMVNYSTNHIDKNSTSVIGINVQFLPKDVMNALGKDYAQLVAAPMDYKIQIQMKMKIKIFGLKLSIPYTYENTLKGLIDLAKS